MDSEFPDEDEEFDLVHQDEYEILKETGGTRIITLLLRLFKMYLNLKSTLR